ncbi:MAG: XisI protein [Cyanobacteria bacterium SID2]|nr:XisI protein [Cyanobacteria bacterium SID2]MBP0003445.1 XisI protein [Cyanobacteria bacterium SBC]
MDCLNHYCRTLQTLLEHYCSLSQKQPPSPRNEEIAEHLILDTERHHYLWLRSGWDDKRRVQHIVLYLRIDDGKIWVETDNTDLCVVDDLLAANIPSESIILGFHHPSKRPLTEFAVGT